MKKSKSSNRFGRDGLKKAVAVGATVLILIVLFFVYFYDPNPGVCTDSDGYNIYEKGTCEINRTSYADSCPGVSVREYSCGANNDCVYTVSACPDGTSCVNGACVNGTAR
ncbi:MAG: hypothetical protein HY515_04340 [Candidatus Aenigmarchaeota archaeon]|nr:hypothetical protein [Candidatus Aenigmarchaeota archaeon]